MSTDDVLRNERAFNEKNIEEFRANNGKVGGPFAGFPLLLLNSTGAKTGQTRTSPVGVFDFDGRKYIVGSAAGRDSNPGWVTNVRKNPQVTVEIGDNPAQPARALEITGTHRDEVFDKVKAIAPGFAGYEAATTRLIPLFEIVTD